MSSAAPTPKATSRQSLIANLSVDQLFAFQTVARAGTVRAAAKDLALSQPAVSQRMRHLESVLGAALFDRHPGQPGTLTAVGEDLLEAAEHILAEIDGFHLRLEQRKRPSVRSFTIVSGADHIKYLLLTAVAGLKRRHPGIRVVLKHEGSAHDTSEALLAGRADVGFCRSPAPEGLRRLGMLSEELFLVAHPNHRIVKLGPTEALHLLSSTDLATYAPGMRSRQLVERWAQKYDVDLNVVIESRNVEAMRLSVLENLAVAVLPLLSVTAEIAAGKLVAVPIPGLPLAKETEILSPLDREVPAEVWEFLSMLPKGLWRRI